MPERDPVPLTDAQIGPWWPGRDLQNERFLNDASNAPQQHGTPEKLRTTLIGDLPGPHDGSYAGHGTPLPHTQTMNQMGRALEPWHPVSSPDIIRIPTPKVSTAIRAWLPPHPGYETAILVTATLVMGCTPTATLMFIDHEHPWDFKSVIAAGQPSSPWPDTIFSGCAPQCYTR